jgi:hypothetical protein
VRAVQGKIATGALRTRIWRQKQQSPACPICQHPNENQNHFFFLCPIKREVWIAVLFKYTCKIFWTDDELCSPLSNRLIVPPRELNYTANQLIACTLLGVWRIHYTFVFDDEAVSRAAGVNIAQHHLDTLISQNNHRRQRKIKNQNKSPCTVVPKSLPPHTRLSHPSHRQRLSRPIPRGMDGFSLALYMFGDFFTWLAYAFFLHGPPTHFFTRLAHAFFYMEQ